MRESLGPGRTWELPGSSWEPATWEAPGVPWSHHLGGSWGSWGPPESHLGIPGKHPGSRLGAPGSHLGGSWSPWEPPGGSTWGKHLERLELPGSHSRRLGALWRPWGGPAGSHLGGPCGSWRHLEALWELLESPWDLLGAIWGAPGCRGSHLEATSEPSENLRKLQEASGSSWRPLGGLVLIRAGAGRPKACFFGKASCPSWGRYRCLGSILGGQVFQICCKKQYRTAIFKIVSLRYRSSLGWFSEVMLDHFGKVLDMKVTPRISPWEPPGRPLWLLGGTWEPPGSSLEAPGSSWEPPGSHSGAIWEPERAPGGAREPPAEPPGPGNKQVTGPGLPRAPAAPSCLDTYIPIIP